MWEWWRNNSGTYSHSTYKVGDEVKLSAFYYSLADKVDNAELLLRFSDTFIATVVSAGGYAGVLTMVGNGKLTVTVYAKYDPSVKQEYTLRIGDEGENTGEIPGDSGLETHEDDAGEVSGNNEPGMPKDDAGEVPGNNRPEMPKDDVGEVPRNSEP